MANGREYPRSTSFTGHKATLDEDVDLDGGKDIGVMRSTGDTLSFKKADRKFTAAPFYRKVRQ